MLLELINDPLQLQSIALQIVHSTTAIQPVWIELIQRENLIRERRNAALPANSKRCKPILRFRFMPRDVRTRWNSTCDMVEFAVMYSDVIKALCAMEAKLRRYELSSTEWRIVKELGEVLTVSIQI